MNFKPFNIHRFTNLPSKVIPKSVWFRGFTARVEPGISAREVHVTMSFCSKKDMYCRKEGVRMLYDPSAKSTIDFYCNARDFLNEISRAASDHGCFAHHIDEDTWLFKYLI